VSRRPLAVLGAEYDGAVLRMVRLEGSEVADYSSHPATAREAASVIREHLDRRTRCLISWGSPGSSLHRSTLPFVSDRHLPTAARDFLNRQIPGGADRPGAGVVVSGLHTPTPSAAVGAITATAATDLHSQLDPARTSLVVAPFTLEHDGLYLAIRSSGVELILVVAGIPVASRHLRCGGLAAGMTTDPLAAHMAHDALETVAAGDLNDPEAVAAARRYVATLVREVHRTIDHWESNGEACPSVIWVYGPGGTLPHLPSYLRSIGLEAQAPPVSRDLELSAIPAAHRLAAYGALSAALAASGDTQILDLSQRPRAWRSPRMGRRTHHRTGDPFSGFEGVINASGTRGFFTPRLAARRPEPLARGTVAALVALVLSAAVAATGWWLSGQALEEADRAVAAADRSLDLRQAEAAYASEVDMVAAVVDARTLEDPTDWSQVLEPLLTYLPALPVAETLVMREVGDSLEVRITTPSALTNTTEWSSALRRAGTLVDLRSLPDPTAEEPGDTVTEFTLRVFTNLPEILEPITPVTP